MRSWTYSCTSIGQCEYACVRVCANECMQMYVCVRVYVYIVYGRMRACVCVCNIDNIQQDPVVNQRVKNWILKLYVFVIV